MQLLCTLDVSAIGIFFNEISPQSLFYALLNISLSVLLYGRGVTYIYKYGRTVTEH